MKTYYLSLNIIGIVNGVDTDNEIFFVKTRNGKNFKIRLTDTSSFNVLQNIDNENRDRFLEIHDESKSRINYLITKYIRDSDLIAISGILSIEDNNEVYDAKTICLLKTHLDNEYYAFEETHWWLTQTKVMANEWLDDLFGDKRTYILDDFVELYRTNLNIIGLPTDDNIQEVATLSRYIYGLSSAYLLTGTERYLDAAKAAVKFQRDTFRILTHDGKYCFWAYGRRKLKYGSEIIEYSLNGDDLGTIPLYEQIYALAGLTQYLRITNDSEVLDDIMRTVRMFEKFYKDDEFGGYFSHIDYITRKPDDEKLGNNKSRKNWNSIGDHIPAYLINLILTLEPIPKDIPNYTEVYDFISLCKEIIENTSTLILKYFNTKKETYVNERFFKDWKVDQNWGWQQNRGIVGHNLKIAWNLTRIANYFSFDPKKSDFVNELITFAEDRAIKMEMSGIDALRGGCYDAVERIPQNNMPIEFTWGNTKDFWQQEQAILAYLILYGKTHKKEYLDIAREMISFWNLYFLDHDNRGIFFRVNDNGLPIIQGVYGNKAGHAIAGYHSFELSFLAHIYTRLFVKNEEDSSKNFVLYFKPESNCKSINVLPDFIENNKIEIVNIKENGFYREKSSFSPNIFQIKINQEIKCQTIEIEFRAK